MEAKRKRKRGDNRDYWLASGANHDKDKKLHPTALCIDLAERFVKSREARDVGGTIADPRDFFTACVGGAMRAGTKYESTRGKFFTFAWRCMRNAAIDYRRQTHADNGKAALNTQYLSDRYGNADDRDRARLDAAAKWSAIVNEDYRDDDDEGPRFDVAQGEASSCGGVSSGYSDRTVSAFDDELDIEPLLEALTPKQRRALELSALDDFTVREVASDLGIRESSAHALLSRAKRNAAKSCRRRATSWHLCDDEMRPTPTREQVGVFSKWRRQGMTVKQIAGSTGMSAGGVRLAIQQCLKSGKKARWGALTKPENKTYIPYKHARKAGGETVFSCADADLLVRRLNPTFYTAPLGYRHFSVGVNGVRHPTPPKPQPRGEPRFTAWFACRKRRRCVSLRAIALLANRPPDDVLRMASEHDIKPMTHSYFALGLSTINNQTGGSHHADKQTNDGAVNRTDRKAHRAFA